MKEQLKEKVSFEFIRYSNCWEDPELLLKSFVNLENKRILSIASAGDNSFSLLTLNPEIIVAVDLSQAQLHLVELKKQAIKHFSRNEVLEFLGFNDSKNRKKQFEKIRNYLPETSKLYWENHIESIENGIIHQGKFERYFQYFALKILPWIHSKKTIEELFRTKSEKEQIEFYEKKWNTWRWRLLFKIFFSKYIMGKYGRDPEFLNEVKVPVGTFIFLKAEKHLKSVHAQKNQMLRYTLSGNFNSLLPHYLLDENFNIIKKHIDKLETFCGYAQDAKIKYGTFSAMNLSNIFEYMPLNIFEKTANEISKLIDKNGKIAYWNLMVPRKISDFKKLELKYEKDFIIKISSKDKGFFYNQFIVETKL